VIVVADSSPIHYLTLIGEAHLLGALFEDVVLPRAVVAELLSEGAPAAVRDWVRSPPKWVRIEAAEESALASLHEPHLHPGESEAIVLAELLKADYLLMDERYGRRVAHSRGIPVVGTLGILEKGDERGMIADFPARLKLLGETSFFVTDALTNALLLRHQERVQRRKAQ